MSHNGCHIKGVMVIACNEALDFSRPDRARHQSWFKIFLSKSWSSWSQDVQVDPVVGDDGVKLLALGHQLHSARESRSGHFGVG